LEAALFQQPDAGIVSLEENPEQHVLAQSWSLIDGVLNERRGDAATTISRSNVVGDFGRSAQRSATGPMRTE